MAALGDGHDVATMARSVRRAVVRSGRICSVPHTACVLSTGGNLKVSPDPNELIADVNVRGSFMWSRVARPHLLEDMNSHILTLSPPLNMDPNGSERITPTPWPGTTPATAAATGVLDGVR